MGTLIDYHSGEPHISVEYLLIIKWDSNGTIASSVGDSNGTSRTITVSFGAKHVTDLREMRTMRQEQRKACEDFGVPGSQGWALAMKNTREWQTERERKHVEE